MYELVGDRIREIFDAQVVDIAMFDRAGGQPLEFLVHVRARPATGRSYRSPSEDSAGTSSRRRKPIVVDDFPAQAAEYGDPLVDPG